MTGPTDTLSGHVVRLPTERSPKHHRNATALMSARRQTDALIMSCVICHYACAEMTKPGSCRQRDCRYLAHVHCTTRMRTATNIECAYCRTMLRTVWGETAVGKYEGESLSTREVALLVGIKLLMVAAVVSLGFMCKSAVGN